MNHSRWIRSGLLALALAAFGTAVQAQQPAQPAATARQQKAADADKSAGLVRTLEIQDGQVLIDGQALEAADVPGNLRLDGMQARFSWVGVGRPVVQLGESYYAVEPDRLVLEPVPALNAWPLGRVASGLRFAPEGRSGLIVDTDRGRVYSLAGEPLDPEDATRELARGTDNLYMSALRMYNESLFRKLDSERSLETRAEQLALRIRATDDRARRTQWTGELEGLLDEIFELKTRNRLAEIQALEAKLEELRAGLAQRERMKQEMIDHRMRQLLGRQP